MNLIDDISDRRYVLHTNRLIVDGMLGFSYRDRLRYFIGKQSRCSNQLDIDFLFAFGIRAHAGKMRPRLNPFLHQ